MPFDTVSNPLDFRQAVMIKMQNKLYNIQPYGWYPCFFLGCGKRHKCTQHRCIGTRNDYEADICGLIDNLRYSGKRR